MEQDFEFVTVDAADGALAEGLVHDLIADGEGSIGFWGGDFADAAFDLGGLVAGRDGARTGGFDLLPEGGDFLAGFVFPAALGTGAVGTAGADGGDAVDMLGW